MKKVNIKETKEVIHELYNSLMDRPQKPSGLLDITDVLLQVYKKLETVRYPEYLINKLVNYIYSVGFDQKIRFMGRDGELLRKLADESKKAGLNSRYRADYSAKSQFYSLSEEIPRRLRFYSPNTYIYWE